MSDSNLLPPVTLIIGGARSGKSAYAERLIEQSSLSPVYLATAIAGDREMSKRIIAHKQRRGKTWKTIEEPIDLVPTLTENARPDSAILIDCLTLWLSNLMSKSLDIEAETNQLTAAIPLFKGPTIFVTNEVGLGIVPETELARTFRDQAGHLHQVLAQISNRVIMMISGLPMILKSSP